MLSGLLIFLGAHSLRMLAPEWRRSFIAKVGLLRWRSGFALVSLVGLLLVVYGFAGVREDPTVIWLPSMRTRYLAWGLSLIGFVLWGAASIRGNLIKSRLHHPLALGTGLWALAHLVSNGMLAHLILFGSIFVWSVASYLAARVRDVDESVAYPRGSKSATFGAVVAGTVAWFVSVVWLHGWLVDIRPLSWALLFE